MVKNIEILDTTLRDGEQTPRIAFSPDEKLEIARKLDELGVDMIEAGSATVSKGERTAISRITREKLNADIFSFCRGLKSDIDHAIECEVDGIHLVIPVSDLHIEKKLNKTRDDIKDMTSRLTRYAVDHGLVVEISGEDSTRADVDFIREMFSLAMEEGADRACICDTTGISSPEKIYDLVSKIGEDIDAPLAVHCHDDFGLATANTLAAVKAGAEEAHLTVNGIGERGGNAALEEVVVALSELYGFITKVQLKKIYETSKLVEKYSGSVIPPSKAIVGENAFSHEAGIHVDGILKDASTYEPIDPEKIGRERKFVVGKHSGKHSIENKLKVEDIKADDKEIDEIFQRVKDIGDSGRSINEDDWKSIVEEILGDR